MAFGLDFFTVAPGLRLAGDSVAFAYKFTGKGGQLKGLQGLEIGLVDDPTVKLLEGDVTGYEQVADRDVAYDALIAGGLTEIVPGLAIGIDSLSSIETGSGSVRLAVAGQQPTLVFRNANVQAVTKVGDGGYTWDLPAGTFTILKAAADAYQSDLKTKVDEMIAARISSDGVLQAAVDAQAVSDATARGVIETNLAAEIADRIAAITAEEQRVDALIASGMWLFASQGDFPAAADNHGRVVHSHADGAIFYAHGGAWHQVAKEVDLQTTIASVASEATTREAADTALSGRLDTLEADPTTATAVAAGDTATLSSANTYTDTSISNLVNGADGALDTLKEIGDALAQGDSDVTAALTAQITTEATARGNADTALSGRLDTLEADPTTATALAAVQSDVDANEADADAAIAAEATTRGNADTALSGRLDVLEADPTTATALTSGLATKLNLAGGTLTGSLVVNRDFPDLELKSNGEKRFLFTDAGGGATGAIKNVDGDVDIFAGGVAAGNKELSVKSTGVEILAALTLSGGLTDAADDTAAAAAGVAVGQLYRNGSVVMIRVS